MYLQDRITSDPRIFDGQPYIRSTRLTVRDVVETLLTHRSCDHLLAEHPELLRLFRQAQDLLWTAPCDLRQATRAVSGYQRALREIGAD